MSLVNWKESKSLGNKKLIKTWGYLLVSLCFFTPLRAYSEPVSASNPASIVSIFLSLLLVIGVVFMLAFIMRRFNVTQTGTSQLKIVTSLAAGTRERIMVIEVGDEQHLIGVTAHNINHLSKLEKPLAAAQSNSGEKFKDKLTTLMASKLNPSIVKDADNQSQQGQSK
jgi:flagellar protein FliO/FliZ